MATRGRLIQTIESDTPTPDSGRELHLTYRTEGGNPVPAILLLPAATRPTAAAVLVHGYSSRKEDVSHTIGRALLARGIASIAIDLPLHGSRADPVQRQASSNPAQLVALWREGMTDVKLALRYIAARSEIDRSRLALVGYSMGSFLSTVIAGDDPSVRALVVAAGGDLPQGTPFAALARMVADPLRAVRKLGGRPLLVVHGRNDRTVRPDQAQRLFDAANEPKDILWYESGHRLPREAADAAAAWLETKLEEV